VIGNAPPDFAALDRLDYLDAAAMEAIRLKPVAPLLFLEANRPAEVGGVHVDAGTPVWGVMRRTALDEAHFPEAAAFRPERWLHGDHVAGHDDPKRKVFGFGAGPRFCPDATSRWSRSRWRSRWRREGLRWSLTGMRRR